MKFPLAVCVGLLCTQQGCHAMAAPVKKGYRVCTSSPCSPNGSELLLDALQSLATEDTTIKEDICLGGCCTGTVVKPIALNARRKILSVMADEQTALTQAEELLRDVDGLDEEKWDVIMAKIQAGEKALENSREPEICQNCGVGLQLYRGNCAKCGKNPY